MGQKEALELVEKHLGRAINNFRGSRDYYRRWSRLLSIATAVLSAATTLLIGLNELYGKSFLVALSLFTAGFATVMAGWSGWLGPRRLWLSNNDALVDLYVVRDQIEYDKALHDADLPLDKIESHYQAIQAVIRRANERWDRARKINSG
jgi:hypothetical protein